MSDVAVADPETAEAPRRGRPPGTGKHQVKEREGREDRGDSVPRSEVQDIVNAAVAAATEGMTKAFAEMMKAQAQSQPAPVPTKRVPKIGDKVNVETEPPEGCQIIVMKDGLGLVHPLPPQGFDKNATDKVLGQIDAAFAVFQKPTDEHPTPKDPRTMRVNAKLVSMFKNFPSTWGEHARVVIDDTFAASNDEPMFRFER